MDVIFEALRGLLMNVFYRITLGLGLTFTTYKSFDALIDGMKEYIVSSFQVLDNSMLNLLSMYRIDDAITILFSAFLVKLVFKGFISGSMTTLNFNPN
ncbi:DUF2523 domain-containing protein [Photobacterium piscicola]|uniref:DUF2523 domain-containing protein n=1 Tax=Photobacterium piscicola TaxID=1378299 RepID=A0ABU6LD01_9GAMM|nr:DUF2523 domain-containing protein [Photobacterium piscicola]